MSTKRKLTEEEERFVKEANDGYFTVEYTATGEPYAVGADHNDHMFSGNVIEKRDGDGGATYFLK